MSAAFTWLPILSSLQIDRQSRCTTTLFHPCCSLSVEKKTKQTVFCFSVETNYLLSSLSSRMHFSISNMRDLKIGGSLRVISLSFQVFLSSSSHAILIQMIPLVIYMLLCFTLFRLSDLEMTKASVSRNAWKPVLQTRVVNVNLDFVCLLSILNKQPCVCRSICLVTTKEDSSKLHMHSLCMTWCKLERQDNFWQRKCLWWELRTKKVLFSSKLCKHP